MTENHIAIRVLIVDDNPAKLTALTAALFGMDLEIVTATSGREALHKLLAQEFAVVLLDVNMPIMDGFETATLIRSRPRSEHLPIIFITAERLTDDARLQGYGLGAVDYIFSPVLPQILRAKVATFVDLHRLRERLVNHESVVRKNQVLEETNRLKSEFLATMSHELRTPLNAIIGFAELLKDGVMGELTPVQHDQTTLIFNSGHHLLSLINDILDLTKVEAGKMLLELNPVNLPTVLEGCLALLREKVLRHHLRMTLDIEPGLHTVQADERKLKQIVYNLLANAAKFTPDGGGIRVTAQRTRQTDAAGHAVDAVAIAVTDSGMGIAEEDMGKLFQPFVQLDASLARRHEGTGLGLAMVKRLVELHGGGVIVTSAVDQGSCFSFWLPVHPDLLANVTPPPPAASSAPTPPTAATHPDPRPPAPHSIRQALIVEDDDAAAALMATQMELYGLDHHWVASAAAALAWLHDHQPALITLDILLPDASGWSLLEQIKSDPRLADVPVLILSVLDETDQHFVLSAAAVLQKPVSRQQIERLLRSLHLLSPSDRRPCILVVDDDPQQIALFTTQLTELDCALRTAGGGREAIALAQQEQPDLLVLDLMMPEINGFDVIEALRANPATQAIPILVLTAKDLTRPERELLNASVTRILQKSGLSREAFLTGVRALLDAAIAQLQEPRP